MTRTRRANLLARALAGACAFALVAAACGGDDDADDVADDVSAADTTSSPSSIAGEADTTPNEPATTEADSGAEATTATTPTTSPDSDGPQAGGELTVGLGADLNGVDPAVTSFQVPSDRVVGLAVYDPLLIGRDGEIVPFVAESFEPNDDLSVWTLTLREGVQFADGTPLDADAVKFNFDRFMDPERQPPCPCAAELRVLAGVEVVDELTVEFTLSGPSAGFPSTLTTNAGMMASPAAVDELGDDYNTQGGVGVGAYMLESFDAGQGVTLAPNPNYWGDEGPYLDSIRIEVIPDDASRVASLQSGELDIALTGDARLIASADGDDGLETVIASINGSNAIIPNFERPPLSDPLVREAVAAAIDTEAIATVVEQDLVEPSTGPFNPASPFYTDFDYPGYDPDAARELLEEYGAPVAFTMRVISTPDDIQRAELVQQMLSEVGIDMTIEQGDQASVIDAIVGGDFDAVLLLTPDGYEPDFGFTRRFFSESPINFGRYRSEAADGLLVAGRTEPDRETRVGIYQDFARQLNDDLAYLWLTYSYVGILHQSTVEGVPAPDHQGLGAFRLAPVWKAG